MSDLGAKYAEVIEHLYAELGQLRPYIVAVQSSELPLEEKVKQLNVALQSLRKARRALTQWVPVKARDHERAAAP